MTTVWSCVGFFLQIYLAAPTIHMPLKYPCGIHLRSVHEDFLQQEAETLPPKLLLFMTGNIAFAPEGLGFFSLSI